MNFGNSLRCRHGKAFKPPSPRQILANQAMPGRITTGTTQETATFHPLMQHMELEFGGSTSLADFERKAQMFNYVDHRAIFEG